MAKHSKPALLWLALAATAAPSAISAAAPAGVAELLDQARFWKSKGRDDLANQVYRRVLTIDPGNAAARAALSQQSPPPAPPPAAAPAAPAPTRMQAAQPKQPSPRQPAAPVAAADTAGDMRAAGFKALEADDINTAATRFQAALKRRPNDPDSLGGLGLARLRAGRFAEARDLLSRASRAGSPDKWSDALQSASFFAGLRQAEAARDAGKLADAESQARQLASSGYKDANLASSLLADVLGRQGRYAEAAQVYRDVAAANSGRGGRQSTQQAEQMQGKASLAQAMQAAASGNVGAAEGMFQQAVTANPDDPWTRFEYARFLLGQGRTAAGDSVMQPLSVKTSPDALYASALYLSQSGREGAAVAMMKRIPEDQLTLEMKRFVLQQQTVAAIAQAKTLAGRGRQQEALSGLRLIASNDNLPVATLGSLADALYQLGDTAGASALIQRALALPQAEPDAYQGIVRVLAKTGQDQQASGIVQQMMGNAGQTGNGTQAAGKLNAILAAEQGDRLRQQGQYASAFEVLQSAWATAPNDPDLLGSLARLYQAGGMNGQAMQVYDMLLRQHPDDVNALIGMADASTGAREFGRAKQAITAAGQRQPNNVDVYLAAARMEQAQNNNGAAMRYLKQARALYLRQQTALPNGGAFPMANPFLAGGGAVAQAPVPVNPFALSATPPKTGGYGEPGAGPWGGGPTMPAPAYMGGGGQAAPWGGGSQSSPFGSPLSTPVASSSAGNPWSGAVPAQPSWSGGSAQPMASAQSWGAPAQDWGGGGVPSGLQNRSGAPAITDPTLRQINNDIEALAGEAGTTVDVQTRYRQRTGETGLSKLRDVGGTVTVSTGFAGGRVSASASPVVVDSGRPTGSGLARFGYNPTIEAQAIVDKVPSPLVQAETQQDSGVAFDVGYQNGAFKADVGSTPIGFSKTQIQGGVSVSPKLSQDVSAKLFGERRPVTDSVVSYAGTKDPVTGQTWGNVMRSGGGASISYDHAGTGVYADASYYRYDGTNVKKNSSYQVNIGGYLRAYRSANSNFTIGANINYQSYANDQNYFSFGHGGYFSPQSFVSLSFPMHFDTKFGSGWKINADFAPGYQSYKQDAVGLYPTDAAAQAKLDALKAQDNDVRSFYDSISKTGFGYALDAGVNYQFGANTQLGGDIKVNTFGNYKEFQTMLHLKQVIGSAE
ncbi:cellulose biosynthesis protein BcsC [Flavisphingomonas formosensis]|uniref:cellulose biosynthesis protein BcsC n=1 Tax=Flavisphingomonas formosensis TaxID=861534 RepID=UPI0012F985E9|nr:cellulose biosynthesis protein BcsC [Sphingomonas formosensis]